MATKEWIFKKSLPHIYLNDTHDYKSDTIFMTNAESSKFCVKNVFSNRNKYDSFTDQKLDLFHTHVHT